jgi:hypothetical protein
MKKIIGVGPLDADSAALTNQKGRMPLRNPPQFDNYVTSRGYLVVDYVTAS